MDETRESNEREAEGNARRIMEHLEAEGFVRSSVATGATTDGLAGVP